MEIKQSNNHVTLDHEQYIKNTMNRIEKKFKHQLKVKNTPLPNHFVPTKKDCPTTETQSKEIYTTDQSLVHYFMSLVVQDRILHLP